MEENFHQSSKLPKEKLHLLMQKNDRQAMKGFVLMYSLFLIMCVWVVFSWTRSWGEIILSQLGFGILCCSIFASMHETVHNTAFKSRNLNRIAAFLSGIAHIYPSIAFRELHFTHHRHTHVPGLDPEISLGHRPIASVVSKLPVYFSWLSGLPLLLFKIMMTIVGALGMPDIIRKQVYPFIDPKVRGKLALESAFILFVYGILLYIALYIYPSFIALFVGQIVGHSILAFYLTPEHNGLPHDVENILEKTRSMNTSKFVKFVMWNMPYHAEHHAYPAIPFHALPQLHEDIKEELKHKELGHLAFHGKVLSREIS